MKEYMEKELKRELDVALTGLMEKHTLQENWALPTAKILCHLPNVGQSANIFFADRF
jgi:hypothetical protein